ncbi:MAG: tRNA 2-thiouridine(34) synthase MnmA [Candidatus Marinimicrobia bacterium]|nr:tRNA 2-thiouridine(34) synthase MnmA [Candidatus Neomarinimicrobiota bacterium]
MSERVILGMSGGVDSAVAGHLLKERGYQVECLFMKNWEGDDDEQCTAEEDYEDALAVCDQLDLPLHSVNFSKDYWEKVFQYFLQEYKSGRTPNPDILCNKEIKFKVFLNYALDLGATRIATGHYARLKSDEFGTHLLRGIDNNKDQTYFLYTLQQDALSRSIFPIGDYSKKEVRSIAEETGFVNSLKKDSTGICFIGERNFRFFLEQYLPAQPGDIVTIDGTIIGNHNGLMYYTLGQRKGIGVGGGHGEKEAPWYVADKDLEKNHLIIVQGREHPALYDSGLVADQLHWIISPPVEFPFTCTAKIRYRQQDTPCTILSSINNQITVQFDSPQFAVTPGQSIVLYQKDECLGGGIIVSSL